MYFDFGDYRPDIPTIGRVISWREGLLLSIIAHLVAVIFILVAPKQTFHPYIPAQQQPPLRDQARFVFVQPRLDRPAPKPPVRAEPSDIDRQARSPRTVRPNAPLPFARGNSPERVEALPDLAARGRGPQPDPSAGQATQSPPATETPPLTESSSSLQLPSLRPQAPQNGANGSASAPGGRLGDALRNLQRYTQNQSFDNLEGGGQFGPEIQFDTKGVEFGPWIRRFIAQVKRNWYAIMPYAAMTAMMKGHVVITFNVHKSGALTDLSVVGPCPIEAFNTAAFGALTASNPTTPLPPEYPDEHAFFTVTFFYNEQPK
jgi:TonB family protein